MIDDLSIGLIIYASEMGSLSGYRSIDRCIDAVGPMTKSMTP
jgi:hypothetical protein